MSLATCFCPFHWIRFEFARSLLIDVCDSKYKLMLTFLLVIKRWFIFYVTHRLNIISEYNTSLCRVQPSIVYPQNAKYSRQECNTIG